jgi:hypothetical protein
MVGTLRRDLRAQQPLVRHPGRVTGTVVPAASRDLRGPWVAGLLGVCVLSYGVAIALSPSQGGPGRSLRLLLFVGASMHVSSTAWFGAVPEVRRHARLHPRRYLVAPVALVLVAATAATVLTATQVGWTLLGFFAWQFFHFQKQNLGLAALAATAYQVGPLRPRERHALMATSVAGIAALLSHPELLQVAVDGRLRWLFPVATAAYVVAVALGLLALRGRSERPVPFVATYLMGLGFFWPVFAFASPYAAVAGLVLAHGLHYLLLMALVAAKPVGDLPAPVSLAILVNVALLGGVALNAASHQHGGDVLSRALFGVYLGLVMAHFVIDAGLWRLRDPFPRALLGPRLPFLLRRS